MSEIIIAAITAAASVAVAMVGIIPTLISNRKETQKTLEALKTELMADNKSTKAEVKALRDDLDDYKRTDGDRWATQLRVRILHFDDDLCNMHAPYPSEPNFQQAVSDCDAYHAYVEQRQKDEDGFHNGVGVAAMEHIVDTYRHCKSHSLFSRQKGEL